MSLFPNFSLTQTQRRSSLLLPGVILYFREAHERITDERRSRSPQKRRLASLANVAVTPELLLIRRSLVAYLFAKPFRSGLMQTQLCHCLTIDNPLVFLAHILPPCRAHKFELISNRHEQTMTRTVDNVSDTGTNVVVKKIKIILRGYIQSWGEKVCWVGDFFKGFYANFFKGFYANFFKGFYTNFFKRFYAIVEYPKAPVFSF